MQKYLSSSSLLLLLLAAISTLTTSASPSNYYGALRGGPAFEEEGQGVAVADFQDNDDPWAPVTQAILDYNIKDFAVVSE
jgi:hypothetical protein